MATSQNGWSVIFSNGPSLATCPPIIGKVRAGDVQVIFAYLCEQFDKTVEDLQEGRDEWGWNVRPVRGQVSGYSNHSSGTAIDLNAMQHPRGKRGTFSAGQVAAIRRILAYLERTVRWGGDYPAILSLPDEMHFEINASAADVHRVAEKIRGEVVPGGGKDDDGTTKPKPPKRYPDVAVPTSRKHTAASDAAWRYLMAAIGHDDKDLGRALQKWLRGLGYYGKRYAIDGVMGYYAVRGLQQFLASKGLYKGKLDGDRGPMTVAAEIAYLNSQRKYL